MDSITKSERTKNLKPTEMFMDVFDTPSKAILKQQSEFLEHLKNNKEHYPLDTFEKL